MLKDKTVSLALGSGGARGFAHIGVIEVLEEEGLLIRNIAGSSMGACIGGVYCAGKMEPFKEWIVQLNKRETFRLMDFTISTQGVLKGKRILEHLKKMLGEVRIEDFDIGYTAISTDIVRKQEVWMRSGDLYTVIRASSAIPTLMMPSKLGDKILVDGGVLNPLPIEPLLPRQTDLIVAVNINANTEEHEATAELNDPEFLEGLSKQDDDASDYTTRMVKTVKSWLSMNGRSESSETKSEKTEEEQLDELEKSRDSTLSYFGMLNKTVDFMQDRMCEQNIAIHAPDIVVNIPRNVGTTLEFYRAEEMIEEGRTACRKAIAKWREKQQTQADTAA